MPRPARSSRTLALPVWIALAIAGALTGPFAKGATPSTPSAPLAPSTSSAPAAEWRVMSFNLRYATAPDGENRWELRRKFLVDTIRQFDPDLLGTQECLAEQAECLRDSLPGYGFVGVGRDDGKLAGEMAALFYRQSRFRILDQGHFWLSETPDVPGSRSWDAALTRIATWARLRAIDDSTRTLLFLNTHFDHQGEVARRRSGEVIAAWLQANRDGAQIVVTGDFNAPARSDIEGPYRALVGILPAAGAPPAGTPPLFDTFSARSDTSTAHGTYHAFTGETSGDRIDWILVSEGLTPVEAAIQRAHAAGRYPSDHFPVTAVLRGR